MKLPTIRLGWLCWLGLFLATGVAAQQNVTSITASQCASIATDTQTSTVGIQVIGTWTGTLQPKVSIQGQAAQNTQVTPSTSSTAQSTITGNGVFTAAVAGASVFYLCGNTVSAGTAVVYLNGSKAAVKTGGAGSSGTLTEVDTTAPITGGPITTTGTIACATCAIGPGASTANHIVEFTNTDGVTLKDGGVAPAGTVTNTGASLPTNAVVLGNTAPDIKASTTATDDGTTFTYTGTSGILLNATATKLTATQGTITTSNPFISHTATWNAAGVAFTNWISNITCTAAATASVAAGFGTAGTQWQFKYNGANCTNPQFIIPAGATSQPSLSISGATNTGMWASGNTLILTGNGNAVAISGSPALFRISSGIPISWASGDAGSTGADTGIVRLAAGIAAFGTGAAASTAGWFQYGGQSRVTTQFDATTNTTLANVTGLTATVAAGRKYDFHAKLFVNADVTGGSKFAIAGTATATSIVYEIRQTCDATNLLTITARQTALAGASGQAGCTAAYTELDGVIVVNAGGTLTVQFAENVSSGTSSVLVNSIFTVMDTP